MTTWNQEKLVRAWNYASREHKGQRLPGSDIPYLNHIGLVVMEVINAINSTQQVESPDLAIQCAVLHDILEDTYTSHLQIEELFGQDVARGVQALTKNLKLLDKKEQMLDSLHRIKKQPVEIALVKLCDRITNLQPPPVHWTKEKIRNYYEESLLIQTEIGKMNSYLGNRLKEKIDSYQQYCS